MALVIDLSLEFGHSIPALQRRVMFIARVVERPALRRRAMLHGN